MSDPREKALTDFCKDNGYICSNMVDIVYEAACRWEKDCELQHEGADRSVGIMRDSWWMEGSGEDLLQWWDINLPDVGEALSSVGMNIQCGPYDERGLDYYFNVIYKSFSIERREIAYNGLRFVAYECMVHVEWSAEE